MSFKVDESFLRFVTMGAMGTRAVTRMLDQAGHCIIELERYSSSNKIWSTKIKRLRLADLLCIHCGTRFEVRTKSDLEVKMSDSPDNVVIHAIISLARCLSMDQVPPLIASLDQHERLAAAAAEVLYRSPRVSIDALAPLWRGLQKNWLATRSGDRLAFVARQIL